MTRGPIIPILQLSPLLSPRSQDRERETGERSALRGAHLVDVHTRTSSLFPVPLPNTPWSLLPLEAPAALLTLAWPFVSTILEMTDAWRLPEGGASWAVLRDLVGLDEPCNEEPGGQR